jgi:hypothetical protein
LSRGDDAGHGEDVDDLVLEDACAVVGESEMRERRLVIQILTFRVVGLPGRARLGVGRAEPHHVQLVHPIILTLVSRGGRLGCRHIAGAAHGRHLSALMDTTFSCG